MMMDQQNENPHNNWKILQNTIEDKVGLGFGPSAQKHQTNI